MTRSSRFTLLRFFLFLVKESRPCLFFPSQAIHSFLLDSSAVASLNTLPKMAPHQDHIENSKERQDAEMFEDVGPEKAIPTAQSYDRFGARESKKTYLAFSVFNGLTLSL